MKYKSLSKMRMLEIKRNGYTYCYSEKYQMFNYIPSIGREDWICFLKQHGYFNSETIKFQTEYAVDKIKMNLANLRQLLIEVTDACNLQCKYCGYGDLYANYDKRIAKRQKFENVKLLIDHLSNLWKSEYNTSYNKEITIGFYGGEPLLNMHLIKEVITYLESFQNFGVSFSYNMTTNCMLLDKYMDYLVEKNFRLLFSLDGNEYNSGYRVDKQGRGSFARVFSNIRQLQLSYPDFFDKNVNFNAVLHNRNSVEEIFTFVKQEFGKIPRVAELNTNGLSEKGREELKRMFCSRYESFDNASEGFKKQKNVMLEDSASTFFHTFVRNFCGNYYNSYVDLFDSEENDEITYIPTGTCRPFERKLFLTVNGKILPCEKIGQNHVLGFLKNGVLNLDYDKVSSYYHDQYEKIIKICKTCFHRRSCGQCMFLLDEKDGKLICGGYMGKHVSEDYFASYLSYAEKHPSLYESVMSAISMD